MNLTLMSYHDRLREKEETPRATGNGILLSLPLPANSYAVTQFLVLQWLNRILFVTRKLISKHHLTTTTQIDTRNLQIKVPVNSN